MANSTKMTKVEMFSAIRSYIEGGKVSVSTPEMIAFIDRQVELINNKSAKASSKPTKIQTENANIKVLIMSALRKIGAFVTISDMQGQTPELAEYTNQKLSALMRQLVESGEVVKTVDKKKSYFTVATTTEEPIEVGFEGDPLGE